jgi:hypothetical protein
MTMLVGPFDYTDDDDNSGVLYVGDPDELPDIWADSTVLMDDND